MNQYPKKHPSFHNIIEPSFKAQRFNSLNTSSSTNFKQKCTQVNFPSNIGNIFTAKSPQLRAKTTHSQEPQELQISQQILPFLISKDSKIKRLFQIVGQKQSIQSIILMKEGFQKIQLQSQNSSSYMSSARTPQIQTIFKLVNSDSGISIGRLTSERDQRLESQKENGLLIKIIHRNKQEQSSTLIFKALGKAIYRRKIEIFNIITQKNNNFTTSVKFVKVFMNFVQLLQCRLQSRYYETILQIASINVNVVHDLSPIRRSPTQDSIQSSEPGRWDTNKIDTINIDFSNKEKVAVQFAGVIWINYLIEKKISNTKHYFYSRLLMQSATRKHDRQDSINHYLIHNCERKSSTVSSHDSVMLRRITLMVPEDPSSMVQTSLPKLDFQYQQALNVPRKSSFKVSSPVSGCSSTTRKQVQLLTDFNYTDGIHTKDVFSLDKPKGPVSGPNQIDGMTPRNFDLLQVKSSPKYMQRQSLKLSLQNMPTQDQKLSKNSQSPLRTILTKVDSNIGKSPSKIQKRRESGHANILNNVNSYVKNNSEPQNIDVEQIDLGRKKSLKKMASLILPSLQKKSWIDQSEKEDKVMKATKIPQIIDNTISSQQQIMINPKHSWTNIALILICCGILLSSFFIINVY